MSRVVMILLEICLFKSSVTFSWTMAASQLMSKFVRLASSELDHESIRVQAETIRVFICFCCTGLWFTEPESPWGLWNENIWTWELIAKTAERNRDGSLDYFSHNCDQTADKKQFRDCGFTLGSQFEDAVQHSRKGFTATVGFPRTRKKDQTGSWVRSQNLKPRLQ